MNDRNKVRASAIQGSILAAGALCLAPGLAMAETSVEVFGIIDVGILTQSKSPTGGSKSEVATSGLRQSVWGLKGSEDLGGGLKAFFNLESHFDVDTGALHGTGDTPGSGTIFFRRQANVGLSGEWGQLIVGRQYGPALLAHLGTEPRAFKEQFSNLYAWAYNQFELIIPGARNDANDVGIFMKNSIQYRNTFGPVTLGVLYSLGEVAGSTGKGSIVALGASYTGPVVLSFSYEVMKDQVTGNENVEHYGVGGAVPFGAFNFKANFLNARNSDPTGARVSDVDAWGIGVDYKWNANNQATLAYYDNKDKDNSSDATRNIVISNDYFISKRTTLYAQAAFVDAKSAASLKTSIVAAGIPRQDAKTTLVNLGINHRF